MSVSLEQNGFEIINGILKPDETGLLVKAIDGFFQTNKDGAKRGGIRHLFRCPVIGELSRSKALASLASSRLGKSVFPVRGIFFDKTPEANWLVSWHQDLTIAVAEKIETTGYGPWSMKEGIPHVQPPANVLERMITLRLHLDDCNEQNGALKVLPSSHRVGKLAASEIEMWKNNCAPIVCTVSKGGLLIMKPLLLHSSSPALAPAHRRVIHLEYAADRLPSGLRWLEN